jgi:ABC-type branched-subunit amino acid transport system substrate-binding protein
MTTPKFLKGAALAALAALIAAPAAAQDLKIGALMPMTGDLQAYGEANVNGIRLAEKLINEAGGVNGGTVTVSVADTQTNPQAGVDAAQKLVNVDGVNAIVGPMASGVTIPVATSVTSREGVLSISPSATSPTVTTLDDNGFLFRTAPSDAFQGVALARLVASKGTEKVAIVFVNNDYGQGLADAFEENFSGTVTAKLPYQPGQASYRGELQSAANGDPEALLLIAYPENGVVIIRQALEGGYFEQFIFTDGMKAPDVIEQIGAEYLNTAYGTSTIAVESQQLDDFRSAYEAEYGEVPPLPYIDSGFDATMLIALAAAKAGASDRSAIRDALVEVAAPPGDVVGPGDFAKALELIAAGTDINYEGAAGSQDFDGNGDVPGIIGEWTMENGQINDVGVIPVD